VGKVKFLSTLHYFFVEFVVYPTSLSCSSKLLAIFAIRVSISSFLVVLSQGSHPFPSRTRKLSLAEPMILRG
jgi:hypothetical protein